MQMKAIDETIGSQTSDVKTIDMDWESDVYSASNYNTTLSGDVVIVRVSFRE